MSVGWYYGLVKIGSKYEIVEIYDMDDSVENGYVVKPLDRFNDIDDALKSLNMALIDLKQQKEAGREFRINSNGIYLHKQWYLQ